MPSGDPPVTVAGHYPARDARGRVALFAGCVTQHFESASNDALARLVSLCGYDVDVVHGCCGALHRHQGALPDAHRLPRALFDRLPASRYDALLHPATGCVAALQDYAHEQGAAFDAPLADASAFLLDAGLARHLQGSQTTALRVALHAPCTQRNVTGGDAALAELLAALPGVEAIALPSEGCCGAAGSKMLTGSDDAVQLASRVLAPLADRGPVDVLISPNVGCAWHLRSRLAERDAPPAVMHPAMLFAQRLGLQKAHRPDRGTRI